MILNNTGKKLQLGQILIKMGALSEAGLNKALEHKRGSKEALLLGEVLQRLNLCTEEQIIEALAAAHGVPFARVSPQIADSKVVDILPREFLDKHSALPLFKVGNRLSLAVNEPANVFLLDEVRRITGCEILVVCATAKDIKATLDTHMPAANVFVIDDADNDLSHIEEQVVDIGNIAAAEDSPIIKLVNQLISSSVREGASDIHIEPDDKALRVRFRIDGKLFERLHLPYKMHPAIVSRIKIMAALDISERRLSQDGGIHVMLEGRPIDLRVSTMPAQHGEKVVLRVIGNRNVLVNLEKVGFDNEMLKQWRDVIQHPNGMVLVTGPTGSGKSTTLYSSLRELNIKDVNICTVEDPVELNLPWVNQFQVNEQIGFTFSVALRSLLRQDPDVIMVGEIRDEETARFAVQAALTGRLVLATLHTNDAPGAITRLLNIGVEPYLVAASLMAALAQRLVRKLCANCKKPFDAPASVRRMVERNVGPVETFYCGAGCARCRNSGYSGRIGIYELLVPDDALRDRITAAPSMKELREFARQAGMIALRSDGLAKVKAGITTVDEVLRATSDE